MKFLLIFLLINFASGIHFRRSFTMRWFLPMNLSIYSCDVSSIDLSANSTHVASYEGPHMSGRSAVDVSGIYFPACSIANLRTFPRGFSTIFPNIFAFDFRGCAYNTLDGDELNEYPSLRFFRSLRTPIVRIPGIFFAATPKVEFIDFDNNRIEHVGEGLLDDLPHLTRVYFRNRCLNMRALNRSEVQTLIEALRVHCPDVEHETTTVSVTTTMIPPTTTSTATTQLTTTLSPTTSTTIGTQPPSRCEIEDLEDFVCGLDEENQHLRERVRRLEEENEEFRWMFAELERKVLYLTARPCAC